MDIKKQDTYELTHIIDGNGVIIGRAEICLNRNELSSFEIYAPYQNKGNGQKALKMLIDRYNIKSLYVKSDNEIAKHVYSKCGFKITSNTEYYRMELLNDK